jgi:hypothetical protein
MAMMFEDPFGDPSADRRRQPRVEGVAPPVPTTPFAQPRGPSGPGGAQPRTDPNAPPPPSRPNPNAPPAPPAPPPAPAGPDYRTLGTFGNRLRGYNMAKFERPYDEWSEKYKLGAVQSWFDPSKGVSAEFLAALKTLDLADYSGSGDWLKVTNSRNGARYHAGGGDDIIGNYAGGQGGDAAMWKPWSLSAPSSDPDLNTLLGGMPPAADGFDMDAFLAAMLRNQPAPAAAPTPAYAPPYQAPAASSPPPSFSGGHVADPNADFPPAVTDALQLLAMRVPELMRQGVSGDALMQQIMRLVAPGGA